MKCFNMAWIHFSSSLTTSQLDFPMKIKWPQHLQRASCQKILITPLGCTVSESEFYFVPLIANLCKLTAGGHWAVVSQLCGAFWVCVCPCTCEQTCHISCTITNTELTTAFFLPSHCLCSSSQQSHTSRNTRVQNEKWKIKNMMHTPTVSSCDVGGQIIQFRWSYSLQNNFCVKFAPNLMQCSSFGGHTRTSHHDVTSAVYLCPYHAKDYTSGI